MYLRNLKIYLKEKKLLSMLLDSLLILKQTKQIAIRLSCVELILLKKIGFKCKQNRKGGAP